VAGQLLRTILGIGKTLAMVIVYEGRNSKISNVHLKWAFSEAACLFLRANERGQAWHQKLVSKYGKAKALSHHSRARLGALKLGRVAYTILKKRTAFDAHRFYESLS